MLTEAQVIDARNRLSTPEVKARLFAQLGYGIHHPEVQRFHDSNARVKICTAPARTTKSYSAAHDVLPDVLSPETIGWVVGPNYELAEKEFDYIVEALVRKGPQLQIPAPKICHTNVKSGLYLKFPWGSEVHGKSAENPRSLLGEKVDWIIYSEASQLPRQIRERFCRPRLITRKGRELIPTTPSQGAEWVYELFQQGSEENDLGIEAFHWDYRANPTYAKEEFELAKKQYGADDPFFREQYLGEWVHYGGAVYPRFDESLHVIEPFDIPPSWDRIRVIDPGHRDPFVCLWAAVGGDGNIYFYREYYSRDGLPVREHAANIKGFSLGEKPGLTVCDPSAKQVIEDLALYGIGADAANNDQQNGRLKVNEYLTATADGTCPWPFRDTPRAKEREKWPHVYFFSTMKETRREFKFFRWKEKTKAIEGLKEKTEGEDHAMDCVRYLLQTRPSVHEIATRIMPGTWEWYARQADTYDKKRSRMRKLTYA